MPQLWLTYDELAVELDCAPAAARRTAAMRGWTRKHSQDGMARVRLPDDMMWAYFIAQARIHRPPRVRQPAPPKTLASLLSLGL